MKMPKRIEENCCALPKGERKTLADGSTKLYLVADHALLCIRVDGGLIQNTSDGVRKCDYLIHTAAGEAVSNCHLIELKGKVIEKAYTQLIATVGHIESDREISCLLETTDTVEAYIVSSQQQEVPRNVNELKRKLAKALAKHCKRRPADITALVKRVLVLPSQRVLVERDGKILCSNKAPLRF